MKKIMFNDQYGLTAAVLNGQKTMTRRFLTQNYERASCMNVNYEDRWHGELDGETYELLPKYQVGEIVAVAQAYKHIVDNHYFQEQCLANETDAVLTRFDAGWDNKMFVKSYYMPHHIRITDIKVERLQNISDNDCIAEGIKCFPSDVMPDLYTSEGVSENCKTAREAFANLVDKVSGKGTWESNPWVFAYSFELIK